MSISEDDLETLSLWMKEWKLAGIHSDRLSPTSVVMCAPRIVTLGWSFYSMRWLVLAGLGSPFYFDLLEEALEKADSVVRGEAE